jgi:aerobic-type carbon monoxide dehydrogenase small subunit (CoxS/CutS family)
MIDDPDAAPVTLTVNGQTCSALPEPGMSLLLYLRNGLGLTGAKIGCGTGNCGACTVLLDGVATQACQVTLAAAQGARVQTIEAVAADGAGARVAAALVAHGAAQCGYCLPGIVVSATAALDRDGAETDLAAALSRNLCRCGTQHRILGALEQVRDRWAEGGA